MARIWETRILRKSKLTDEEQGQLALLYQNVTANLEARKRQQWQVLVFYSAVTAFLMSQSREMSETAKCVAAIATIIGAIPTGVMIWLLQCKIKTERKVLERLYLKFSEKFNFCRNPKGPVGKSDFFEICFCWGSMIYLVAVAVLSVVIFLGEERLKAFLACIYRLVGLK